MIETLSKFDCARRQLVTAIWLLFEERDAVSVYTLASNALEILTMLCKNQRVESFLEIASTQTGTTALGILKDHVNPDRNFFKHADREPDLRLQFSDENCDSVIFTACHDLLALAKKSPVEVQVFIIWFGAVYPEKAASSIELMGAAERLFPGLSSKSRDSQKQAALEALQMVYRDDNLLRHPETDRDEFARWMPKASL